MNPETETLVREALERISEWPGLKTRGMHRVCELAEEALAALDAEPEALQLDAAMRRAGQVLNGAFICAACRGPGVETNGPVDTSEISIGIPAS